MVSWRGLVLGIGATFAQPESFAALVEELGKGTAQQLKGRVADVLRYHWRSKHFLDVQAALPETLDWSTQPSPWRSYLDAPAVHLPTALPHAASADSVPLSLNSLGSFLRLGAGISAWKSYDGVHAWALRVAPSSGNLQTTEVHLVLPPLEGLAPVTAAYHYQPEMHHLELRLEAPEELVKGGNQSSGAFGFLVILSSLCVREAWKYGERALRSCHLNLGHMLQALSVSCDLHGWMMEEASGALILEPVLRRILDVEDETPELALWVTTGSERSVPAMGWGAEELMAVYQQAAQLKSLGDPSPLSAPGTIYPAWPVMDAAQEALKLQLEDLADGALRAEASEPKARCLHHHLGAQLLPSVLRRRSALGFVTEQYPRETNTFSDFRSFLWAWRSLMKIHLLLMLHDVEGFQPGLYLLQRASDATLLGFVPPLTEVLALQGCKLWRLAVADVHHAAQISACGQDIASRGSFAAAFVGNFHGWTHPRNYAELLWQSGALGQVLYLAAEAAGFGATGMGCFMDDMTLALLRSPWAMESKANNDSQSFAPTESQYQVLYHFAVGKPSVDPRLLSFEAYQHLQDGFYYEALQGGMGRIVQAASVGEKCLWQDVSRVLWAAEDAV
eukprot:s2143_g9.t2